MFWLGLIVAVISLLIYIVDRRLKTKFNEKFNPSDWGLTSTTATPTASPPTIAAPTGIESNLGAGVQPPSMSYVKKTQLFTDHQRAIAITLHRALSVDQVVFSNIKVADVLMLTANGNTLAEQVARKNMSTRQFDFMVCNKTTLAPLCAIMVGDILEPTLVNMCDEADLPLARFKVQAEYDVAIIRASLSKALGQTEVAASIEECALEIKGETPATRPVENESTVDIPITTSASNNDAQLKRCPECSSIMLKRKAKNGVAAGKLFWICSTYPTCREKFPII